MKFRSLISALVVFTIVMCAMSAVSAATFTTTTNYTASGVQVVTDVTGITSANMVSYVIFDKNDPAPSNTNIKYIDQKSVSGGTTSFTVTDTVAKLDGNKILLGSNGEAITANDAEKVVNIDNDSSLVVAYDGVVNEDDGSVTFLVSQNLTTKTGINVVATDAGGNVYEFVGLMNLSEEDAKYYAINLIDNRENGIDFSACTFEVTPVLENGTVMTNVANSNYWVAE